MSSDLWRELAPGWERGRELLWESTRVVSEWLVERLDPRPDDTVLDLAAGTGETGFLAAARLGPGGRLVTSDRSPEMVDAARRLAPAFGAGAAGAEFRVLDASRLDVPDASVDGVLSRFGYVLRGEPPAALAEVRRVLRPGGRFAFAVWAAREQNAWMTVPAEAMVARGHLAPPGGEGQRLSARRNPEAIRGLLAAAGFEALALEELPLAYRFPDAGALWFFVSEVRGPVALALRTLPEAERAAVRAEVERRALTDGAGGGFALGGVALCVLAA